MLDSLQCRPCRKTYFPSEVQGRRSCPVCKGPLISQRQIENYRAETQATLNRLKHQSMVTLAAGASVAMAVQMVIDWYKSDSDYRALSWVVFVGSVASLVAAAIWWKSGKKGMMLLASMIFQATALVYALCAFAASTPLIELAESRSVGRPIMTAIMIVAVSPLGLSMLAWHQYRSYVKILNAR